MIAATLQGPNYFTPNHDERSIEVFPDLGAAITALLSRYATGNYALHHVEYLNGDDENVLFPAFGEGTSFEIYELAEDFTPADGDIERVLTAVHGGWKDYILTLASVSGSIAVTVIPG